MSPSEQNMCNFLDGCNGGPHAIAYYAERTGLDCKPFQKRQRKQYEVMQGVVESSRDIQWQLYALMLEQARLGNPEAVHLRGLMARRFDEIEPVEIMEEEHETH